MFTTRNSGFSNKKICYKKRKEDMVMLKECSECHGKGYLTSINAIIDYENALRFERITCPKCNGKGFIVYYSEVNVL
jgi:DnaJ-class molecular chaperone